MAIERSVLGSGAAIPPPHTTAARLGMRYRDRPDVSDNPDKSSDRRDDGRISSGQYAEQSRHLRAGGQADAGRADADGQAMGLPCAGDAPRHYIDLDYHHALETWLARRPIQRLLGWIARDRFGGRTIIEEALASYANPQAPGAHRFRYWPLHRFIDHMRGSTPAAVFRERIAQHASTVRGLVVTARSIAEFGLTLPQRFSAPLFAVWNFTNQCNLACRHCYQDAEHDRLADELTLSERLALVDDAAAAYLPMIAFAGGEPTLSPHLLPVLRRCRQYGIHTTVATNGTTMTPALAERLADAGVKYVEISLDSVDPARHDAFRGQPGMWRRSVRGMRVVAAQPGLRLGVAMCVHQDNLGEVEAMLRFAVEIGAGCLAHFNFIPVGRGLNMTRGDLTPQQREELLRTLNRWMQSGRIGVISTAPQLGRVCLAHAPIDGRVAATHAGSGGGEKTRVVSKYLGGCGAGRTYVCIEPNGDLTPCVYLPHRVMGNVRRRRFLEIFRDNQFADLLCDRGRLTGHCEVCRFKHYCGGCRARADAYFGTLNGPDPGCLFNDRHWDRLGAQDGGTGQDAGAGAVCGEPVLSHPSAARSPSGRG